MKCISCKKRKPIQVELDDGSKIKILKCATCFFGDAYMMMSGKRVSMEQDDYHDHQRSKSYGWADEVNTRIKNLM